MVIYGSFTIGRFHTVYSLAWRPADAGRAVPLVLGIAAPMSPFAAAVNVQTTNLHLIELFHVALEYMAKHTINKGAQF